MSRTAELMAAEFPIPSPVLVASLDELRLAETAPPTSGSEIGRIAMLPRPWDPASCPHELRHLIYLWLDNVVAWINEEHTWRVDHLIPICWIEHPHIVHELAPIACLRWEASYALTPGPLKDWQQHHLPNFLDRIAQLIGPTGCPPGRHQPQPGQARNHLYFEDGQDCARRSRRARDFEARQQAPS